MAGTLHAYFMQAGVSSYTGASFACLSFAVAVYAFKDNCLFARFYLLFLPNMSRFSAQATSITRTAVKNLPGSKILVGYRTKWWEWASRILTIVKGFASTTCHGCINCLNICRSHNVYCTGHTQGKRPFFIQWDHCNVSHGIRSQSGAPVGAYCQGKHITSEANTIVSAHASL